MCRCFVQVRELILVYGLVQVLVHNLYEMCISFCL